MTLSRLTPSLLTGKSLSYSQAKVFFLSAFKGELDEPQIKAWLLLMADRGETPEELRACADALQAVEKVQATAFRDLLDTCGTGGDGKHSINVSTLAAFTAAGAGLRVAKHGNRAISSRSGSSDVMEALGVRLDAGKKAMMTSLRQAGIAYFHAPFYHPVFARLQPLRKKMGTRTIFNLLGPLVNPCRLAYQLTGVSRPEQLKLYAEVLRKRSGLKRALVCHSADGMDEISLNAKTRYALIEGSKVRYGTIDPAKLGFKKAPDRLFRGGSARENAAFAKAFLSGKIQDPRADLVMLNAGAAIWLAGMTNSLAAGIQAARQSVETGRALRALETLVRVTREAGERHDS